MPANYALDGFSFSLSWRGEPFSNNTMDDQNDAVVGGEEVVETPAEETTGEGAAQEEVTSAPAEETGEEAA